MMKILFSLMFCLSVNLVFSQTKIEKEFGVEPDEVPAEALSQINQYFSFGLNTKWFREESESGISYEAKFSYKSHDVSIEFSENGQLEDTEVKIKWKEIKSSSRKNIEKYFAEHYSKYKVYKVQRQYLQPLETVSKHLQNDNSDGIEYNFEIEYYGKDTRKELWEGTFDQEGHFLSKRKIIVKPTDNLQY